MIEPSKTISVKVMEELEKDILSGFYKPGEWMIESEIANRLGVSRGPVREALLMLERRGLIKEKDGNSKGRVVVTLSAKELRDIYQIRTFIETQCLIHLAMEEDTDAFEGLYALTKEMERLVETEDMEEYREINKEFHHRIVRSAENEKLYALYQENDQKIRWFGGMTLQRSRLKDSHSEHVSLLESCRRGDIEAIVKKSYHHQTQAMTLVVEKMSSATHQQDSGRK